MTDCNAAEEVLFRLRLMHPEITIAWAKVFPNLTIKAYQGCRRTPAHGQ
ncbi:hypothetical protein [Streptomyces sp. ML-6]|nr:hypothetical protein [Streptomyces sp. ML-6]MDK0517625.1 hypothetical protein [Streptomyces sp. ML-6]